MEKDVRSLHSVVAEQGARAGAKRSAVSLAVAMSVLWAAAPAHAEEKVVPWFLTMSEVLQHDSNLLRDNDRKTSDTISMTKAKFGLDKYYGRQHYRVDGTVAKNKYKDHSEFDNDSYTGSGSFTTDVASDFRLNVTGNTSRQLPQFQDSTANRQGKNVLRAQSYGADLRYGLYGRMSANAGVNKSKSRWQITTADNQEARSTYVGFRYLPSDLVFVGLQYTKTATDYPDRQAFHVEGNNLTISDSEHVDRNNVSVNGSWQVTGLSLLSASVGVSDEKYRIDDRRDFTGLTGYAAWKYTPAGKVSYDLSWSRDTNNSGGYTSVQQNDFGQYTAAYGHAFNRITNTLAASARYDATSKIQLSTSVSYIRYDEEAIVTQANSSSTSSDSKQGRYVSYSIGLDYQPIDAVGLGCSLDIYSRTQSNFSPAYDGRAVSCYAAFTLQ